MDMDRDLLSPDTIFCHGSSQPGVKDHGGGGMRMGLYGSYNGLTARIPHAIVWFTTSMHQNFDLGFIFCARRDDFCY
jgi:hypothetical protein